MRLAGDRVVARIGRVRAVQASGLVAVAILAYAGSFTGPPVIGAVAAGTTLSRALGLAVAAALTVAALARRSLR